MKLSTFLVGAFAALAIAAPASNDKNSKDVAKGSKDGAAKEGASNKGGEAKSPSPSEGQNGNQSEGQNNGSNNVNFDQLNNLNFRQQDLNYLFKVNNLDLGLLQQLSINNGFNSLAFANVFNSNSFDINSLLQLQQLQTFLAVANTGVFSNSFNLGGFNLGGLNLGAINGIGGFNVGNVIDVAAIPQVQAVVSTSRSTLTQSPFPIQSQ